MSAMWKCYHCKKEIAPRAPKCPHCGGVFNVSQNGFMEANARIDNRVAREKVGLPSKGGFGCAIPAAILGMSIISAATLIGVSISEAQEIKLTQVKAQKLIDGHIQNWARCLDIPTEDVFAGFNNRLTGKKIVQNMCLNGNYEALFQSCLVTSNRFQDDIIELETRKVIQRSKRDNRDTVFIVKNNISNNGYYVNKGNALCGHFPNTKYISQITRIEQTTDMRWEVSFTYKQTSNDTYYQRKLFNKRLNDKKAVEYQNGKFVVQDN